MYPLFETINIVEGIPQHLKWHQQRVDRSFAKYFGVKGHLILEKEIAIPPEYQSGQVKCRFSYNISSFNAVYDYYTRKNIASLKVVYADDIDYSLKFSDRSRLKELLEQWGSCDDILIVKEGQITDTSYTNIVFFNGSEWHTPIHPLLEGTQRNRLIEEKVIHEYPIALEDLQNYRFFKLINAMMDFYDQKEISTANIIL